jgi:putative spermidine/putrescine transport system substrate-binding protein
VSRDAKEGSDRIMKGRDQTPCPTLWQRGSRSLRLVLRASLLAAALLPARAQAEGEATLAVASWGGAYGQSQEAAYFEPFAKKTGIKVRSETYDGSLAALKPMLATIDVVDVSPAVLNKLCGDGLLEKLDSAMIEAAPDGKSAADDFIAGGLSDCGVASMAWATAIALDRQAFGKNQPSKIGDLLDLKRYPGKRALPKGARYTLELALMADGVEPSTVYSELATPQGADRAFAALDKIKPEIIWWDEAQDPIAWLTQKKASMAAGYSGRIFRAVLGARQRLDILWDGQIYDLDVWAVPKDAKNKDAAKNFIAFASLPGQMAMQSSLIAYGPMRKSAIELVGKHPSIDIAVKPYLPTAPNNFSKALRFDEAWWTEHGTALEARFNTWLQQSSAAADGAPANPSAKSGADKTQKAQPQAKPSPPADAPANPKASDPR